MEPEKNDVDISKLFAWSRTFDIENSAGEVEATIYMKLLGDADVNRARVFALRKSAELRRKLHNPDSDERLTAIRDIEEMEKSDIINYIGVFSLREITNRAMKEVEVPYPKAPRANAKMDKMEKYQQEIDEYHEKREKAIRDFMQVEVEKLKKQLDTEDKAVLYKRYVSTLIDEFCEREALRAYSDMEVYLGCFKDTDFKIKAFNSFEEFDNLDSAVKADFKVAYSKLNPGMEELKKLREATQ